MFNKISYLSTIKYIYTYMSPELKISKTCYDKRALKQIWMMCYWPTICGFRLTVYNPERALASLVSGVKEHISDIVFMVYGWVYMCTGPYPPLLTLLHHYCCYQIYQSLSFQVLDTWLTVTVQYWIFHDHHKICTINKTHTMLMFLEYWV